MALAKWMAASGSVKSGKSRLLGLQVNPSGSAGQINVNDSTDGTGDDQCGDIVVTASANPYFISFTSGERGQGGIELNTGLYLTLSACAVLAVYE